MVVKNVFKYKKWIFFLNAQISGFAFSLINISNADMEKEQISVLNELTDFENINHNVKFAGDFNVFFMLH